MLAVVTGASGHLGANLIRSLIDRKWKVRALVHYDTRALEGLSLERASGDVLIEESLRQAFTGADVVFHLAGRISVVSWDSKEVEAINITGVQNVVNACMAVNMKRLIHTSSMPINRNLSMNRLMNHGHFLMLAAILPMTIPKLKEKEL